VDEAHQPLTRGRSGPSWICLGRGGSGPSFRRGTGDDHTSGAWPYLGASLDSLAKIIGFAELGEPTSQIVVRARPPRKSPGGFSRMSLTGRSPSGWRTPGLRRTALDEKSWRPRPRVGGHVGGSGEGTISKRGARFEGHDGQSPRGSGPRPSNSRSSVNRRRFIGRCDGFASS